jgi:hypothetical protein
MQNFSISKTHALDNIQFFKENSEKDYVDCIQGLIQSKPFGDLKFYIHSFVKRVDDISGLKKMYHHPRLTKPDPTPGATLMRVDPNQPEVATIMWTLPNQENFEMYRYGKMFSDPFVHECVQKFLNNRESMSKAEPDDLPDHKIKEIYKDILLESRKNKRKQKQSAESNTPSH